ncbi:MAG: hypothetical protein ACX94B_02275 [Henriciella sp.]|nr:hypothetical protein [Hyphomonadaceae bacterium]
MTQHTFKSAKRRYFRAFWPLMALYVIIVLAGSFGLNQLDPEPKWLQATLAIACAVPVIATLLVMLRYVSETDEYTRLVQLKGFAWGGVITVSGIFIVGFLQLFHVIENFEVFWFGPAFFIAYGLSTFLLGGRDCL